MTNRKAEAMNEVTKMESQGPTAPATIDPMVTAIERFVMDPTVDLDKLERMLAMKERLDAEAQKRAYFEAMAEAQAQMEPVARNKRNEQTNSNYSDLAAIYKACKPIAAAHGLSFSTYPSASEKDGFAAFRWVNRHSSGHMEEGIAEMPLDDRGIKGTVNKTGVHAFGSTASYARRYLFTMIYDIATSDDNDGNRTDDTVTEEQFRELRDLLERSNSDEAKFKMAFGARDPDAVPLERFPAAKFAEAKRMLETKIQRGQGQ